MADLANEVKLIRNMLTAFINQYNIDKGYTKADTTAERKNISENTFGVAENGTGILDLADLSDENSTALEEIAEMLDDHEQRISALEGR